MERNLNHKHRGIVVIALAAVLIHTLFGGGGKDKYSITFSTQNIVAGDTAEATLNGVANASSADVVWTSSDNNVVSVSGDGIVCTLSAKSTGCDPFCAESIYAVCGDRSSRLPLQSPCGIQQSAEVIQIGMLIFEHLLSIIHEAIHLLELLDLFIVTGPVCFLHF